MMLFLRILPFLVGACQALVFWMQLEQPLRYPWIVLIGVCSLPLAVFALTWKRIRFLDVLEKMIPTFVLVLTLAFGLLLAEGAFARTVIIVLAALASMVSLEFLFLLICQPERYPVNGLSRLNLAYVPLIFWYVAATSSGLLVFVHADRGAYIIVLMAVSMILFRTTGYPGASFQQHLIWMTVGAMIGLHVALLGIFLPINMAAQGMIAALVGSAALRARRYMYTPLLSPRQAWIEGVTALVAFIAIVSTAKWI
jgi:hypothetical protein